jgi:MYXO-CTERM domain-containing protein
MVPILFTSLVALPAPACETFGQETILADLAHPDLAESSGLAASRETPGALWTHDDSGDPVLFRFTLDGTITPHAFDAAGNRDWEDLAAADCPGSGSCLYVGDIGEDRSDPQEIRVYVGREPRGDGRIVLVELWELRWPGAPRDAETLLVHPCTLDAWIITRGTTTEVFRIPDDRGPRPRELVPIGVLDVDEPITSGDFSPDGTSIVLRSDASVWRYRVSDTDRDGHWSETPERLFDLTRTGEAIAWDLDGDLLVTDEGQPTPVGRIACEDAPPAVCEAPNRCGCATTPTQMGWLTALLLAFPLVRRRWSGTADARHRC